MNHNAEYEIIESIIIDIKQRIIKLKSLGYNPFQIEVSTHTMNLVLQNLSEEEIGQYIYNGRICGLSLHIVNISSKNYLRIAYEEFLHEPMPNRNAIETWED